MRYAVRQGDDDMRILMVIGLVVLGVVRAPSPAKSAENLLAVAVDGLVAQRPVQPGWRTQTLSDGAIAAIGAGSIEGATGLSATTR